MSLADKLVQYILANPKTKLRIMSSFFGVKRSDINTLLHSKPEVFRKDKESLWSLEESLEKELQKFSSVVSDDSHKNEILVVENVDLAERLKSELLVNPNQKAKKLAANLDVSRQLTNRTLHSYQDIFIKDQSHSWSVRPDCFLYKTGVDAEFDSIPKHELPIAGPSAPSIDKVSEAGESIAQLPVVDFTETVERSKQLVIEARLYRNFLVLAPPGTGKTYTLIERLIYAIAKSPHRVDAGEFLVLSFTRAAVGEIRDRISKAIAYGAPSSLRYVQVKTFDAYATWLLHDGGYDIVGKTFDERIELLSSELSSVNLKQLTDRIGRSRYLFVDEIQDLVGVRADMVFELVKRILARKGSVTLLGDPHQSLNDYQVNGNQTNSGEFLEKVQKYLDRGLESVELEESYRYETTEMQSLSSEAKKVLDRVGITAEDKLNQLVQLVPEITQEQLIKNFSEGSTDALLCRSNGEVFQWFNWQEEQGNPCKVNAGAIGRPWPAWIGQVIMHYQPEVITREQLLNRLSSNVDDCLAPSEQELDGFLLNERLIRRNVINLEDLAFRLKYLSPANKGDEVDNGLIVSTVHKAKGLEYKNVVVLEPKVNKKKGVTDEDVRVLYVAITRAKRSISMLPKNAVPFSGWIQKKKGGHLGYTEEGIKFLQVLGLEDFDLETLFITEQGGVDNDNLENYLLTYQEENNYSIRPESCIAENDHNYALYLNSSLGPVRLCAVGEKMKISLDAMSWGNKYAEDGALLNMGEGCNYQTIVHPMESPILARHIGPSGIMVFPLIQGFYPLSRATGE